MDAVLFGAKPFFRGRGFIVSLKVNKGVRLGVNSDIIYLIRTRGYIVKGENS